MTVSRSIWIDFDLARRAHYLPESGVASKRIGGVERVAGLADTDELSARRTEPRSEKVSGIRHRPGGRTSVPYARAVP